MGHLGSSVKKKSMSEILAKILAVVISLDIEVSMYRVLIDIVYKIIEELIFRYNFNFIDLRPDLNSNQDHFDLLIIFSTKLSGTGYRKGWTMHTCEFSATSQMPICPSLHPVIMFFWSGVISMAAIQWVGGLLPHSTTGTTRLLLVDMVRCRVPRLFNQSL